MSSKNARHFPRKGFFDAFPDAKLEPVAGYDAGQTTIDEWIFRGTHTGPLTLPNGESIAPPGKRVSVPGMDIERGAKTASSSETGRTSTSSSS